MTTKAEEKAYEVYPDIEVNGIALIYSEQRRLFQEGYEQAEKETIERVISWVRKNAYIYTDTQNDEEGNLMTVFLEEAFINDLKKAMEEEV